MTTAAPEGWHRHPATDHHHAWQPAGFTLSPHCGELVPTSVCDCGEVLYAHGGDPVRVNTTS